MLTDQVSAFAVAEDLKAVLTGSVAPARRHMTLATAGDDSLQVAANPDAYPIGGTTIDTDADFAGDDDTVGRNTGAA